MARSEHITQEAGKGQAMITNDYHLEIAKAELAKWRHMLVELDAVLAGLPRFISAQVGAHRPATLRQRILELETEIQQYGMAKPSAVMPSLRI